MHIIQDRYCNCSWNLDLQSHSLTNFHHIWVNLTKQEYSRSSVRLFYGKWYFYLARMHQIDQSILHIDNKKKCLLCTKSALKWFYEGECNTDDWSKLLVLKLETPILISNNISQYCCFFSDYCSNKCSLISYQPWTYLDLKEN